MTEMMKIDYTIKLVSITLIFSMQQNINQSYEIRLPSTFTSFLTSFFTKKKKKKKKKERIFVYLTIPLL